MLTFTLTLNNLKLHLHLHYCPVGDRLLSSLKLLLQDSVFAGGRPIGEKIASAQILIDRIMQRPEGLEGRAVGRLAVKRTVQDFSTVVASYFSILQVLHKKAVF